MVRGIWGKDEHLGEELVGYWGFCSFDRMFAQHAWSPWFPLQKPIKNWILGHICNPSTWRMEAGRSEVQSHPRLLNDRRLTKATLPQKRKDKKESWTVGSKGLMSYERSHVKGNFPIAEHQRENRMQASLCKTDRYTVQRSLEYSMRKRTALHMTIPLTKGLFHWYGIAEV